MTTFTPSPVTLAEGFVLLGWWKALFLLVPFIGWGWVVSKVYDKHAARFHLARDTWNTVHLVVALVAFVGVLLIPISEPWSFLVAFGVLLAVLLADLISYPLIANRDERVPEEHRLTLDLSRWKEQREAKAAAKQAGSSELGVTASDGTKMLVPDKDAPEFAVRVAAESLVLRAREVHAAQVDLLPAREGAYVPSYLVDGVRQNGEPMPAQTAIRVIDFWKQAAGLDTTDRRRRQTGDCNADDRGDATKIRVTASGTQAGMRLSMLFNPEKAVRRKPDDLGLLDTQMEELRAIAGEGGGVVLVAAPPDSGGTTTLYAALRLHDAYTSNVQTIEIEPQSALEGVRQNRFDPTQVEQQYATLVRSILRRDPDVVGIADLPDQDTARNIVTADVDRSRVYVQIRADGVLNAVQLWAKAVGDLSDTARHLRGVISQKLVRRLCVNCRVPYTPSPEMLAKLGLPADRVKQLYKKGGQVLIKNKPEICPACAGVGYQGQVGVFEVVLFGDAERALVKKGDLAGLRAELRRRKIPTIQQAALRRAVEGITSVEEVLRVTTQQQTKKPQPAKPRPAAQPKA